MSETQNINTTHILLSRIRRGDKIHTTCNCGWTNRAEGNDMALVKFQRHLITSGVDLLL